MHHFTINDVSEIRESNSCVVILEDNCSSDNNSYKLAIPSCFFSHVVMHKGRCVHVEVNGTSQDTYHPIIAMNMKIMQIDHDTVRTQSGGLRAELPLHIVPIHREHATFHLAIFLVNEKGETTSTDEMSRTFISPLKKNWQ